MEILNCQSAKIPTLFESDKSEVAQYLFDNVDWNLVFSVMSSLKRKYNSGAETFVKADIVAKTIEEASNYKIEYIDEIGCDFFIKDINIFLEMKSTNSNIFPTGNNYYTPKLKIKNFRSLKNIEDISLKKTFDYLLLLEPLKSGIVPFEKLVPHFEIFSDGVGTKANINDIELIKEVFSIKNTNILLMDRYEEMKKQIIHDIRKELYYE